MPVDFTVRVTVRRNDARLIPYVGRVTDECAEAAAEKVQVRARNYAPKRTGRLAASITTQRQRRPLMSAAYRVGSPLEYAPYQERGTRPITARPGGVLAFAPAGGATIFRPRTRGVLAVRFMARAVAETTRADFQPDGAPIRP